MKRTRVKICGITNPADAIAAVGCGVDALGLNFFENSSRYIDEATALEIVVAIPAFVTIVGVFVDSDAERVAQLSDSLGLDLLQFHGSETAAYCESFEQPYMKAIAGGDSAAISDAAAKFGSARAILLDTAEAGQFGGTGETFDWSVIPAIAQPLVLAGGITPDNAAQAISQVNPWALDLASGVEKSKGVKDVDKMNALMTAVANADAEIQ